MRRRATALVALVIAGPAAGCGGGNGSVSPAPDPVSGGPPARFPIARGRTLADLAPGTGLSLTLAPSVRTLTHGINRYAFGLYDPAGKQVVGARVALYTARADRTGLRGPYAARSESLSVEPRFRSRTNATNPDAAKDVYVAAVPFRRSGEQLVMAVARLDGRLVMTRPVRAEVARGRAGPPRVGGKAIRVRTGTLAAVRGDAARIDTRRPPATDLLRVDLARVLGRRPVVIVFATPARCGTRVCGPVLDIVEEVKARGPRHVAYIHQEMYRDDDVHDGLRRAAIAWRLRTEPWTFVISRRGRIVARFEGAFSARELRHAIAKVAG